MLEIVLVSSNIETVGVKSPGRKKIFCLLSDTLLYMDIFRLETLNSALLQNCPFYKLTKLERSNGDDVDDVGGDVDEGMVRQAHISLPPARPH